MSGLTGKPWSCDRGDDRGARVGRGKVDSLEMGKRGLAVLEVETRAEQVGVARDTSLRDGFRFVDLFAGLGGFHVALDRLGGECVFASEWVPALQSLYERNFGVAVHGDITKVDVSEIPEHDFLTAGFPCQPFSKAGEQLGFDHTLQGQLFFEVLRILEERRPQAFVLENVPNLLRHNSGDTFAFIKKQLQRLGYDVSAERRSPHQFGIPQVRDRLYIVGAQDSLDGFEWPEAQREPTDIRSVLDVQPTGARQVRGSALTALDLWQEFLDRAPSGTRLPSFPLWAMEWGATYEFEDRSPQEQLRAEGPAAFDGVWGSFFSRVRGSSEEEVLTALPTYAKVKTATLPGWKRQFIRQNRDFYAEHQAWIAPWLPKLAQLPTSFQKMEWNVKGGRLTLEDHVIQMRASGLRIKRATSAPALVAMTDSQVPIIGWERRYMTPKECARLQGLQRIELPASEKDSYRALGNAVNADVVERIAESLLRRADNSRVGPAGSLRLPIAVG